MYFLALFIHHVWKRFASLQRKAFLECETASVKAVES